MSDEKKDPTWKPGEMNPGDTTNIILESAKPVATGTNKYGEWNMWIVNVENTIVIDKETKAKVENYSGKAICFPSTKLHEQFVAHTNLTKEGVKLKITTEAKKNNDGQLYTSYKADLLEEGSSPANSVDASHLTFINDFKKFVDGKIVNDTKDDFMGFGKSDTYKIPEEMLEKLWAVYQEK